MGWAQRRATVARREAHPEKSQGFKEVTSCFASHRYFWSTHSPSERLLSAGLGIGSRTCRSHLVRRFHHALPDVDRDVRHVGPAGSAAMTQQSTITSPRRNEGNPTLACAADSYSPKREMLNCKLPDHCQVAEDTSAQRSLFATPTAKQVQALCRPLRRIERIAQWSAALGGGPEEKAGGREKERGFPLPQRPFPSAVSWVYCRRYLRFFTCQSRVPGCRSSCSAPERARM